jgi:hypothetical protein
VGSGARAAREADRLAARLGGLDAQRGEGDAAMAASREGRSASGRAVADAELSLRLSLPAPELADLVGVARAAGRLDGARDEVATTPHMVAVDVLRGSLRLMVPHLRVEPPWGERWARRLYDLRATLERRGGGLTIEAGPAAIVGSAGAWGHPGAAAARLTKGLRGQFDPGRILSPGRWTFDED